MASDAFQDNINAQAERLHALVTEASDLLEIRCHSEICVVWPALAGVVELYLQDLQTGGLSLMQEGGMGTMLEYIAASERYTPALFFVAGMLFARSGEDLINCDCRRGS